MPDQSDDEPVYELVLPLVVTGDGKTYEERSFVAGANFGQHCTEVRLQKPSEWVAYVAPEMVPQYDLLAMSEGYTMTSEPWDEHPDEWTLITFTKADDGVA